ncbi:MAG: electron transfer flavoprotein subunit alpha/FixB family protein [Spirochaetia bacterium]|nr:electron transfer flavoprotein subunit alpha/FixB family protein [Spirochaetia bacterium]
MKANRALELDQWKGVWVIAEQRGGKLLHVTYELMGEGRRLADKRGSQLTVVILGYEMDEEVSQAADYGADRVIYAEHPLLKDYTTDGYKKVLNELVLAEQPEIVLVGATSLGRDLAPRLAASLGTGLTADCTGLDIDETDGRLLQTRPAFGGNLMAVIVCPRNRPQISTVRPGVMVCAPHAKRHAEIIRITPEIAEDDIIARVKEIVKEVKKRVSLGDAEIIISGGRGVGGPEGFALLQKLADQFGGVVGASRAAVDSGWIHSSHQVGQTGTTVRPKVYIACGISGAVQHLAGMSESECIITINTNANAPIHAIADFRLVGDLFTIVPALSEELLREMC